MPQGIRLPKEQRNDGDFYPTPYWVLQSLLDQWSPPLGPVLEPAAGSGNLLRVLRRQYPDVELHAVELMSEHADILKLSSDHLWIHDFLTWAPPENVEYGAIITNPPFSLAQYFVEKALTVPHRAVAMLLPLNFLASRKRYAFWQTHPCTTIAVLSERPSFNGAGTAAQDYAWFIWDDSTDSLAQHIIHLRRRSN